MNILNKDFCYKKSRLQQLKGFYNTYRLGTTTKAAEFMGLNPSTITLQIQSLERDLGISLFMHEGRKLVPTEDGRLFFNVLTPRLQAMDGIFEYFKEYKKSISNKTIRIATHRTVMSYIIPQYTKDFLLTHPDIKIILQDIRLEKALERLVTNETDIAIYPSEKIPEECESINIFTFDPVILVNRNNPISKKVDSKITFEDLSKQNVIMVDKRKILPYFIELCEQYNIGSNIEFEGGDWEIIRNFVKLNIGIHLFSDLYNYLPIFKDKDIVSKNVKHLFPKVSFNLITKKGRIPSSIMNDFINLFTRISS